MARRKKIKTEKTGKKKKKKKATSQLLASLVWPGLVWSYHIRGSHSVGRGVDTQSEGEATVIRGGNGMAVMAQHKEPACAGCLTEGLTD